MQAWKHPTTKPWLQDVLRNDELYQFQASRFDAVYGNGHSWDVAWLFAKLLDAGLTIVPAVNLIRNIGCQVGQFPSTHSPPRQHADQPDGVSTPPSEARSPLTGDTTCSTSGGLARATSGSLGAANGRNGVSSMTDISLVVFDFDGVMTDNRVRVHQSGDEAVWCHRGDGLGIAHLKDAGVEVVVLFHRDESSGGSALPQTERPGDSELRRQAGGSPAVRNRTQLARGANRVRRQRHQRPGVYAVGRLAHCRCRRAARRARRREMGHASAGRGRSGSRSGGSSGRVLVATTDPAIEWARQSVWQSLEVKQAIAGSEQLLSQIVRVARGMTDVLRAGGRVFFCGNGGSAADAQHLAAELVGRFALERRALPAMALSVNTSVVTAIGNDYGYEQVFSRQLEGLAHAGDMAIGITTSGNSANVVRAMESGRAMGLRTIAMTGARGGQIRCLGRRVPVRSIGPHAAHPGRAHSDRSHAV